MSLIRIIVTDSFNNNLFYDIYNKSYVHILKAYLVHQFIYGKFASQSYIILQNCKSIRICIDTYHKIKFKFKFLEKNF